MARKRETSQTAIIDAAVGCFAANGYHATKTRDIALAAGVSEGTLYNYFKDKQALFLAVVEHINEVIDEYFHFAPLEGDAVLEHFRSKMETLEEFVRDNRHYAEILVRDLRHREASAICADFMDRHSREKHDNILALARACNVEPTEDEAQTLALCFNGGLERIISRWCVGGGQGPMTPSPKDFIEAFIRILQRAGGKGTTAP